MDRSISRSRRLVLVVGFGIASAMSHASAQAQELCGGVDYPFPYTDVSGVGAAFCPGIMEAYVTGVSKGTTPTTFSPNETVSRVQMTTFLQRSLDQGLARTSRRGAIDQWWTTQSAYPQTISVGGLPFYCASDGENIWVSTGGEVVQVQASTGKVLGTWTGVSSGSGIRVALGLVWIVGEYPTESAGSLFALDPAQAPGLVNPRAHDVFGADPLGVAFDGVNLWTANYGPPGSVSFFTVGVYYSGTITKGFDAPYGILYDGAHIWVTDNAANTLLKLDVSGNILQTVNVGSGPRNAVFDGANIWVPNEQDSSMSVVQASTGDVIATITDTLSYPFSVTFDGERILVTNAGNDSVSLFKAADLGFIANVSIESTPFGACSDGINFWVTLVNGNLLRF